MKKILILNASPRKNGTLSRMLGLMKEELESKGSEVTYIEVCKLQVRPLHCLYEMPQQPELYLAGGRRTAGCRDEW